AAGFLGDVVRAVQGGNSVVHGDAARAQGQGVRSAGRGDGRRRLGSGEAVHDGPEDELPGNDRQRRDGAIVWRGGCAADDVPDRPERENRRGTCWTSEQKGY